MKERPILFSGEMVRAIIEGRKTQTRRVVKSPHTQEAGAWSFDPERGLWESGIAGDHGAMGHGEWVRCPYGVPGDRLWVRETARAEELPSGQDGVRYAADDAFIPINSQQSAESWLDMYHYAGRTGSLVPSIHMPRWASRITLEVTGVRIERLQDISEADARAEGVESQFVDGYGCWVNYELGDGTWCNSARGSFCTLWDSINAKRGYGWDVNPWVWVVEFWR